MKSALITGVALALINLPAAVHGTDIISGADAQAILAARAAGTRWCQLIEQITDATTGAIVQQTCRCVASIEGIGGGNPPGNEVLAVAFGPAQPCPLPGVRPDRPQIGDARAQINKIDAYLQQLHQFLQHMWDGVDRYAYQNDPVYRYRIDNWVADWGKYGAWINQQLLARRQAYLNIVTAGGAAGTPVLGPDGKPIPGPDGVVMEPIDMAAITAAEPSRAAPPVPPMNSAPSGGSIAPMPGGSGILGQEIDGNERQRR